VFEYQSYIFSKWNYELSVTLIIFNACREILSLLKFCSKKWKYTSKDVDIHQSQFPDNVRDKGTNWRNFINFTFASNNRKGIVIQNIPIYLGCWDRIYEYFSIQESNPYRNSRLCSRLTTHSTWHASPTTNMLMAQHQFFYYRHYSVSNGSKQQFFYYPHYSACNVSKQHFFITDTRVMGPNNIFLLPTTR